MNFSEIDKLVDLGSDIAVVDSSGRLVGVVTMFPAVRQPTGFERLYRPPRPSQRDRVMKPLEYAGLERMELEKLKRATNE